MSILKHLLQKARAKPNSKGRPPMFDAPLRADILEQYDALPRRLQVAARWALDHPQDIALLSMREQARRAGVVPVTMTRLAQRLGYSGYEAIRALYVEKMRRGGSVFSGKAKALVERHKLKGDTALAFDLLDTLAGQIHDLTSSLARERLKRAARQLGRAERIYVIGQRASYPVAFHFAYVLGLAHAGVRLLDGPGATGMDALRSAGKSDALVAVSVRPYTRGTVEATAFAVRQGIALIAITDSELSPLCGGARASILVPTESPSFFHTMAPAFAVAEALAALVAAASGDEGLAAVRKMERQFAALSTHTMPHSPLEIER
jgi:DNA-binding MurR/RpiR family transcriptional regulator